MSKHREAKVTGQKINHATRGVMRFAALRRSLILCLLPLAFLLSGCRMDMQDQPRYEAYEKNEFFDNKMASRPPIEGTVARGSLRENAALYTGRTGAGGAQAALVDTMPIEVNERVLARGQDRFNAFCAACHGLTGKGDGMVVRRGFRAPPPMTNDRLLEAPVGHFFDVMTNGFGAMPDYAAQISPEDRWAIVAYIRALQLSQRAPLGEVPESERQKLEAGGQK